MQENNKKTCIFLSKYAGSFFFLRRMCYNTLHAFGLENVETFFCPSGQRTF